MPSGTTLSISSREGAVRGHMATWDHDRVFVRATQGPIFISVNGDAGSRTAGGPIGNGSPAKKDHWCGDLTCDERTIE